MSHLSQFNNSTYTTAPTQHKSSVHDSNVTLRVIFGIIAFLSLLGNGLVCTVILKRRNNLRNSYNLMILALAIVDTLTGICLIITPSFIIGESNFPVPSGLQGEFFCRLVSSHYFLFTLGKISVALVMCLAIDRWFAIYRPLRYQTAFKKMKVFRNIAVIVVICCAMNSRAIFEKRPVVKQKVTSCKWVSLTKGKLAAQIYVIVHVTVTFFIPLTISWGTFLHLLLLLKKSTFQATRKHRGRPLLHPLRMCALTALFLGICWLPNQFYFLLSKFDVTQLGTSMHHMTAVLSMFNSCMNPWIYGATNKKYRNEFKKILCFWKRNQIEQSETDITGAGMALENANRKFSRTNGRRNPVVKPANEDI